MKHKLFILLIGIFFLVGTIEFVSAESKIQMWKNMSSGTNVSWVDNNGNWYALGNINISGNIYGSFYGTWNGSSDYYLNSNPYGFYNVTTLPNLNSSGLIINWNVNGYIKDWNSTGFITNQSQDLSGYYLKSNPSNYWNSTFATFNKTYADTLYAGISWAYNQTTAAVNILNGTGLVKDWNGTGLIKNWSTSLVCPTGMILVPASPQDGMDEFCVDKYEAKNVGGIATSQAATSATWGVITQYNARAECIRAGKHLITEKERQAIAHNIESVGWNWNGGVVGTNQMSDGHSDNTPSYSLAADVTGDADDDPCVGTGQTCNTTIWDSQRRTYKLSNNQYIWDFGGNVWEWVDQVNSDEYPIYNSPAEGLQACSTSGDGICGNTKTTNDQWYRGGTVATRGFLRGGAWYYGARSGAFALDLHIAPTSTSDGIGFRCCSS